MKFTVGALPDGKEGVLTHLPAKEGFLSILQVKRPCRENTDGQHTDSIGYMWEISVFPGCVNYLD